MPAFNGVIPFSRTFSGFDAWLFLRGVVPFDQDDKWFIYIVPEANGGLLRICRSWTGFVIWEVRFELDGDVISTHSARVNLDRRQRGFGAPEQEEALLDTCISTLVLGSPSEWPFFECDDEHIARAAQEWEALGFQCYSRAEDDHLDAHGAGAPAQSSEDENKTPVSSGELGTHSGLSDRTIEALMAEIDYDVQDGPALDEYPLQSAEGREAFLERLVDFGEPGIFAAVAHVWSSLARPAAARCTQMGLLAGTGGTGKKALHNVLTAYVREWLGEQLPPLPPHDAYGTLDEWHRAAMAAFATEHEREIATVKKYAAILNGEAPGASSASSLGATLLKGPWRLRNQPRRQRP